MARRRPPLPPPGPARPGPAPPHRAAVRRGGRAGATARSARPASGGAAAPPGGSGRGQPARGGAGCPAPRGWGEALRSVTAPQAAGLRRPRCSAVVLCRP